MVEQLTFNQLVQGSSPCRPTKFKPRNLNELRGFYYPGVTAIQALGGMVAWSGVNLRRFPCDRESPSPIPTPPRRGAATTAGSAPLAFSVRLARRAPQSSPSTPNTCWRRNANRARRPGWRGRRAATFRHTGQNRFGLGGAHPARMTQSTEFHITQVKSDIRPLLIETTMPEAYHFSLSVGNFGFTQVYPKSRDWP